MNVRPFVDDDAAAVAALFSAEEERLRDEEYQAFHDVLNEAFAEHWEWHPPPFEEWFERREGQHRDEHGPIWFVVRDGDELAAVTRNDANVAGGGAVRLYERVGMVVETCGVAFEKAVE